MRDLRADDAADVAAIYNASAALATFDEGPAGVADVAADLAERLATHPCVGVLEDGRLVAYAVAAPHSTYPAYTGIAEFSVYVLPRAQGRGLGRRALTALIERAEAAGVTKLLGRVMSDNHASRRLCAACGFREVGVYERHARQNGAWRDVVIVERLLGEAAR